MLEAAKADLALEAGFCPCEKARQAFPEIWSSSSSTRTNDISGFAMAASVLSRAARRTELRRSRGTKPPLDVLMTLQGGESIANLTSSERGMPERGAAIRASAG